MKHAEIAELTNNKSEKMFDQMMVTIGDSLCDLACSDHGEDLDNVDDEETEQGTLSEHDEPSWVMSKISNAVQ
jgi:hypothetical protein